MPILSLNIDKQTSLFNSMSMMDGYDAITPGVESGPKTIRVQFKLGAARRTLVKNAAALKASLAVWEETRKSIFKECFPEAAEGATVQEVDGPEAFKRFREETAEAANKEDKLDLLPFPESVIYGDNDFPAAALLVLEEHGLIV